MLDGLAFLPIGQIEEGLQIIREDIPDVEGNVMYCCEASNHYFNPISTILPHPKLLLFLLIKCAFSVKDLTLKLITYI